MTKTLQELLAEGQVLLAQKDQERLAYEESADNERNWRWASLRKQARQDLGELAEKMPATPPEDFSSTGTHVLTLTPWGEPGFTARYMADYWYDRDKVSWHVCGQEKYGEPYSVYVAWEPAFDDEGRWYPHPTRWETTVSLVEAIALCHSVMEDYDRCREECARKSAPKPPSPEQNRRLTNREKRLLDALNEIIHEGLTPGNE